MKQSSTIHQVSSKMIGNEFVVPVTVKFWSLRLLMQCILPEAIIFKCFGSILLLLKLNTNHFLLC